MKMFALFAMLAVVATADDLVWPADFWQSVTNRIEAVAPSASQIDEDAVSGVFDSRPMVSLVGNMPIGLDTFDSRPYVSGVAQNGITMNSMPPGILLIVR